jgi:hypothetical protein
MKKQKLTNSSSAKYFTSYYYSIDYITCTQEKVAAFQKHRKLLERKSIAKEDPLVLQPHNLEPLRQFFLEST